MGKEHSIGPVLRAVKLRYKGFLVSHREKTFDLMV